MWWCWVDAACAAAGTAGSPGSQPALLLLVEVLRQRLWSAAWLRQLLSGVGCKERKGGDGEVSVLKIKEQQLRHMGLTFAAAAFFLWSEGICQPGDAPPAAAVAPRR